jgi:hypothetical protein
VDVEVMVEVNDESGVLLVALLTAEVGGLSDGKGIPIGDPTGTAAGDPDGETVGDSTDGAEGGFWLYTLKALSAALFDAIGPVAFPAGLAAGLLAEVAEVLVWLPTLESEACGVDAVAEDVGDGDEPAALPPEARVGAIVGGVAGAMGLPVGGEISWLEVEGVGEPTGMKSLNEGWLLDDAGGTVEEASEVTFPVRLPIASMELLIVLEWISETAEAPASVVVPKMGKEAGEIVAELAWLLGGAELGVMAVPELDRMVVLYTDVVVPVVVCVVESDIIVDVKGQTVVVLYTSIVVTIWEIFEADGAALDSLQMGQTVAVIVETVVPVRHNGADLCGRRRSHSCFIRGRF